MIKSDWQHQRREEIKKKTKEIRYNDDLAPNLEKKVLIIHVLTIS